MTLGPLNFTPRTFGPRLTCPRCQQQCTLRLSLRLVASICGFVAGTTLNALLIVGLVVSGYMSASFTFVGVALTLVIWTAVTMLICFKFGVLVKA